MLRELARQLFTRDIIFSVSYFSLVCFGLYIYDYVNNRGEKKCAKKNLKKKLTITKKSLEKKAS